MAVNFKLYQHYSLYGFSNSYILGNDETGLALIVDPGEFTVGMLNHVEKNGYYVSSVLLTHSHIHHVRGLAALLRVYDAMPFGVSSSILGATTRVVRDGERLDAAGFQIEVLSVPGHSPDSVIYSIGGLLFTGDAIVAGLPGKTLSTYNARLLADRIRKSLIDLPDETVLLPGHGPPSTLGSEKRYNPVFDPAWAGKIDNNYDFFV
ncbi:MAG TPA: MBL fold metallo-hydrolase [Rectinemataceae bacterium]|nr:MBL fold metallo-hydrolase [Rectinemataceae bacterium]